ncbi:MAG: AAA family ATPase [Halieaceae bacterium]|nr:AAA family ATPase [Halieaceae bacterium]
MKIRGLSGVVFRIGRFFQEARRRKLVQTALGYCVSGWLIIEVGALMFDAFEAPPIALRALIVVVVAGFPVALTLSWIYDITSQGLVRTENESQPVEPEAEEAPRFESMRKQLTVLCAAFDLISDDEETDPEDLIEVQPRATEICQKICERFEGRVVPGRSGEMLAYFGFPVAHEEAVRNATRAALSIVNGISRLAHSGGLPPGLKINARAAVHTGDIVIDHSAGRDDEMPSVIGVVPGETQYLLDRCKPGEVLITDSAHRIVNGFFEVTETDRQGAQGRVAWSVSVESGARNRLEARSADELLPLIGRDLELSMLQQHWRRAEEGQGQVVMLTGGPGMGKSHLVHTFKHKVAENPQAWMSEIVCDAYSKSTALHPLVELFQTSVFGAGETGSSVDTLLLIEGLLAEQNQDLATAVPLFASFMNVPLSDAYEPSADSAPKQRQALHSLLLEFFLQRSARQPLLIVVEELHWADPSTLELLSLLVEQVPTHRIMCLFSFRDSFEAPWKPGSNTFQINLGGVEHEAALEICRAVSPKIPADLVELIAERADGVPLFIEEVARNLVESGKLDQVEGKARKRKLLEHMIPDTLKDALTSRLDRLGEAQPLAQLGAAVGREFSHDLIAAVAPTLQPYDVEDNLERLVAPEILYRQGTGRKRGYRFKHALLQEAAYQSMIKKRRAACHAAIAEVLEASFPEMVELNPEIMAVHFEGAGDLDNAIEYLVKAANQALLRAALVEALTHLEKGLELVERMPEGRDRNLKELSLQTLLGSASMFAFGYASSQALEAFSKAESLCGPDVPIQQAVPVIMGLSAYHSVRGAMTRGQEQNQRILEMAEASGDDDLRLWGEAFMSVGEFYEGRFESSLKHLAEVERLYDPERHKGLSITASQDPMVFSLIHGSQASWILGNPAQGLAQAKRAEQLAEAIGHPLVLQQALGWGNVVFMYAGKPGHLIKKAGRAHAIAVEQNIPFYVGGNSVWWGAGLAAQGDHQAGIEKMRSGLDMLAQTGAQIGRPMMLTLVAQSMLALGRLDEAQQELEAALEQVEGWGERFYLPETLRVFGELHHAAGRRDAAESRFEEAVAAAEEQKAVNWKTRIDESRARM